MNFTDTLRSVDLVLQAGEVPLLVGETGIGKTYLAHELARKHDWSLVMIDGNLLKEGEIGGLPTVKTYMRLNHKGEEVEEKTTVYAVHHTLREIDDEIAKGRTVLLFIDEINRCEHAVQQELMNLVLNKEINGYHLRPEVRIIAAMNPSNSYEYQAVDMDAAQENRFVWLYMEADYMQWLDWAASADIDPKVMEFISTFPEYLHQENEDDINATPRSYERISGLYKVYKNAEDTISKNVFFNVIRGNVGKVIAEEFVNFITSDYKPLISYEDVFEAETLPESMQQRVKDESHTRLYLAAKNMLGRLSTAIHDETCQPEPAIDGLMAYLKLYPVDLMVGVMKDIRNNYPEVYKYAQDNDTFINAYFESYRSIRWCLWNRP